MTREKIKIGNHTYIADLYKSNIDFKEQYYNKFVMIRNYELYNQVIVDKDIYFIERSLYFDIVRKALINNEELPEDFIFPSSGSKLTSYTNNPLLFNGLYNGNSIFKQRKDLYEIYFNEIKNKLYSEYPSYLEDIDGEDHSINSRNFIKWIYNQDIDYTINGDNFKEWISNCDESLIIGDEVYELYDEHKNITEIECDKIKIYIPLMENNIDGIIHVSNYINSINFHYLCRKVSDLDISSEQLFTVNNFTYCEYYNVFIPNIKSLFRENVYFNEDLNLQISEKNTNFINKLSSNSYKSDNVLMLNSYNELTNDNLNTILNILKKDTNNILDLDIVLYDEFDNNIFEGVFIGLYDNQHIMVHSYHNYDNLDEIMNKACKIVLQNSVYFIKEKVNGIVPGYTYDIMQLKVLLQPYRIVQEYIADEVVNVKQYIKQKESVHYNYLTMPISLSFFPYSELEKTTNLYLLTDNYNNHEVLFVNEYKLTIGSSLDFNKDNLPSIKCKFIYDELDKTFNNFRDAYYYYNDVSESEYIDYKNNSLEILREEFKELYDVDGLELEKYIEEHKEEIEEEYGIDFDFIGFYISICTDDKLTNVIWNKKINVDLFDLDDEIYIPINGIFTEWKQIPEKIICSIKFFDRYIGNIIYTNTVVITKEWIKYMMVDTNINVKAIMEESKNLNEIVLDGSKNNFINNITCIINKSSDLQQGGFKMNSMPKILYKPYFFKVQDLQNIKLRSKIVQNIGINLAQYMTKVESFKLIIDGNEYIEIGRNDIYVIFGINANEILNISGRYDVFNQDDEYISSGQYSLY